MLWGEYKAVVLSLSGAVISEVENLETCSTFWESQEEKCLTSVRLVQMKYLNDNETLFYLVSKCHSCLCPPSMLLAILGVKGRLPSK